MSFGSLKKARPPAKVGTRLTLWGMGTTLAVCAVLCCGLYVGLSVSLHREVDSFLEGEVQEFLAILHEEKDDSLETIERDIRLELGSRWRRDLTFRLLDTTGRVVVTSDPRDALPDPWKQPTPPKQATGVPRFDTIESSRFTHPVRVCSQWADLPARGEFLVQATYSLRGIVASLTAFRRLCIGTMILAAGLSLIAGRLLARKILRPVHRMTVAARRVRADKLSRRLSRTGNEDELDRLAAVLNEMLERLERQFKQIQQFTADAAHEFRTPLTALRGNAEVALSSHVAESELRGVLEASIEEYDRLSRIADDLLLLARADSGCPFLSYRRFALQAAVQDVVDLYAPLAQDKGVSLAFTSETSIEMDADGSRIRQVISNLLDNALKFTPAGGRITVSVGQTDSTAELAVADSGPGISAEHLPHVFDRFYRVDRVRTREGAGAGLGLSISRTIVEAHGGSIRLTSRPGSGTTVIVRLPFILGS
jgi:heavy metal sensor kinase